MTAPPFSQPRPSAEELQALRETVARVDAARGPVLPFGVGPLDHLLAGGGLDGAALHEVAAASANWSDDAAATLFAAGIAARFASPGLSVLWALTRFDLYAPGLEQAGLGSDRIFYAQGANDRELLAMCEDALRDGALACVVAELKAADQTATRRLQLAASEGKTPMLLYRRYRRYGQCPLTDLSLACTRWRIGSLASTPLSMPGVGRGRWSVELVRQRGGPPFSLELEACDDQGRLALPATTRDRAVAAGGADLALGHAA
ncbi:ImuA family protein [Sphingopyxis sp. JAI128]|uniref:ImuA family protein n=1 Tax=Sphingopyxis sp. JAI128 TaxID=2723066 RepID=UPI0016098DEA|nr:protein ImuA [Sphingopyxis sp. JAI128]MBB6428033.1 protein ImuA [Sphingopyxis sp. JAI128]